VRKLPSLTLAVTALALGLAACGGSSSSSSSSPPASSATSSSTASTPPATSTSTSPASSGGGAASHSLAIAADPSGQLKFTKSTLTAKAGAVTITFTNSAPLAHNLTVEQGTNGPMVGATPTFQGGPKTLKLQLKPGTYTYFCSVPGHRAGGMQGTLTVQ
jgi:plastocyanin